MKYKSQQERTMMPIRKTTKKVLDKKAKKQGMTQIDFIDFLVL